MDNRFKTALALQDACNISGVARTLVTVIDEARSKGIRAETDPAVQMVVYKLAALAGFEPLSWEGYDKAHEMCVRFENDTRI